MKERKYSLNASATSTPRRKQGVRASALGTGTGKAMGCSPPSSRHSDITAWIFISLCNITVVVFGFHFKAKKEKKNSWKKQTAKISINHLASIERSIHVKTLTKICGSVTFASPLWIHMKLFCFSHLLYEVKRDACNTSLETRSSLTWKTKMWRKQGCHSSRQYFAHRKKQSLCERWTCRISWRLVYFIIVPFDLKGWCRVIRSHVQVSMSPTSLAG